MVASPLLGAVEPTVTNFFPMDHTTLTMLPASSHHFGTHSYAAVDGRSGSAAGLDEAIDEGCAGIIGKDLEDSIILPEWYTSAAKVLANAEC